MAFLIYSSKTKIPSIIQLLIWLINIMNVQTRSMPSPVEIIPFTHPPGLFFEDIGHVRMITNEWNIINYYNLRNYWQELEGFKKQLKEFDNICNRTPLATCHNALLEFRHQLNVLEDNNNILYSRTKYKDKLWREKRGLINVVGNVANSLFGILDDKYAEQIEKQIDSIHQKETRLVNLVKNQTSIADATLNILKKTQDQIQRQFESLAHHIASISQASDSLTNQLEDQRNLIELNSFATHMVMLMINYQRTQDAIIDAVMDIHHGKISPLLITPKQLPDQLALIRAHLPSTLTIPEDDSHSKLERIYQILSAKIAITPRYILFNIKMPLASTEQFQLFNLIPVPTHHGSYFVFIKPSSELLVANLQRDHYYPMSREELQLCSHLENTFLCSPRRPIYNTGSNMSRCELSLLNHEDIISPTCHLQYTPPSKFWMQLHSSNSWIYVMDSEYTMNIICEGRVYAHRLKGEGLLKINPNCVIKQSTMTIYSHNLQESQFNSSFTPSMNFKLQLTTKANKTLKTTPEIFIQKGDEIDAVQKTIKELKANIPPIDLHTDISPHDIHQYSVSYILVFTLLGLAVYIIIRKHREQKPPKSIQATEEHEIEGRIKPIPAKRHSLQDDNTFVLRRNTEGEHVS